LSEPNYLILVLHSSKLRFIESECDLKMNALFITHHWRYSGRLCYLWFQFSHAKIRTVWP